MNNKEIFSSLLRTTNRLGIKKTLTVLENIGFFEAPASRKDHLAIPRWSSSTFAKCS